MTALSIADTFVNPRFTKLHDDRPQREQYSAMSRLVRIDHLNRSDSRAAWGAVRASIRALPNPVERQKQLAQLPHWRQFAALLGFYHQAAKLGFMDLHLSVKQIEELSTVCRAYVNFMHRWLCHIGWLNVRPGLVLGIKHHCQRPHEGDCMCREAPWNRTAIRTLTSLCHKALRIFHWVKAKVLFGCDVLKRAAISKDFEIAGLPGRTLPGEKQKAKGGAGRGLAGLWERGQKSMRFALPKKEQLVKDMNDVDPRHEAMKTLQRERLRLTAKGRGGDVLAATECLRRWPQFSGGFDFPPKVREEAEARVKAQRDATSKPDDIPF